MDDEQVIRDLKEDSGIFEVYRKHVFECVRDPGDGEIQTIDVTIFDAGEDVDPQLRYRCTAMTQDGKMATGNPADSVDMAIRIVHWQDLASQ